ncbi:MAG TPA: double zinc ribbon domain-containing protein, partial [Thermodesulfobacteriota bacterium]|nr:double zinc ribbon domain-containing protein [Thermodesulfobacteriota bacterium]
MLDLIFPELCSGCDTPVSNDYHVCEGCISGLRFLSEFSCCAVCGAPFGFFNDGSPGAADTSPEPAGTGHLCGRCLGRGFSFDRARSIVIYDG